VVRWFGAVQAQDFNGAKWALGLRMRAATNASVEEAFNRGEIVRTHLLRPTWHFVTPEDLRWLLELTGPRVSLRCGSAYRAYELDPAVLKRTNSIIAKALKGGKHLTRAELKAKLNRAGIAADDSVRMGHILLHAEVAGVVCSGPLKGKQFTYALLEERVPAGVRLSGDEALAELTRRYFASHGPATLTDFVWWSGLTTNDARAGIALLDRELAKTRIGETIYWDSTSTPTSKPGARAHLLPAYDEYNVAYKNRETVFHPTAVSQLTTWGALGPTIIVDGKLIGIWKATPKSDFITIALTSPKTLTRSEKHAITAGAEAYAAFLGTQCAPLL
ncbi:MAG TPA: winged helix DNA-binding domain-containing protein, partial [Pyrinomonadaceae bacterium]|nr:winged helix DNA-binding domain-containing protein [Pyrinomonadaceae bacterium]